MKYNKRILPFPLYLIYLFMTIGMINCVKDEAVSEMTKESSSKSAGMYLPSAKFQTTIQNKRKLIINVIIPTGHHAYLDSGRDGNLLPILFYWQELIKQGVLQKKPVEKSRPIGSFDSLAKATVLRGNGVYVYETRKGNWKKGTKLRVRTQICNERKGQCYPPVFKQITLN